MFPDWNAVNMLPSKKKNMATNCHVKESPLGDTCTQRDRIWEPASHSHVNAKAVGFQSREETHVEGGRTDVQLYENSDQLMAIWQTRKPLGILERRRWESYEIHGEPWHASHALMREYVIVLHLHMSESSMPLGPVYEAPGSRALTVNAAKQTS